MIGKTGLAALAALTLLPGATATAQQRRDDIIPGRYVVLYASVADPAMETDTRERRYGFRSSMRFRRAIGGFAARLDAAQVRALQDDPEVLSVSPDRIRRAVAATSLAPGEPLPPTGVLRMDAGSATGVHAASDVGVAVIDTGISLAHPDLRAAAGTNCTGTGAPQDDNGHGTHVAGSIAAENDGAGVTGVAPGTQLYAVKVLDSKGSGTSSQVICGIEWVTANAAALNIKVANMSLGGGGPEVASCATTTDPEHKAICNSTAAGVTYVVAAGNSGWDFDYASVPDIPAAYPEALTVTAVSDSDGRSGATGGTPTCRSGESDDRYASFSNWASTTAGKAHTIAAPGVCIRSTWLGGTYDTISGTSMAAPHMAAAVALCLSEGGVPGPCAGKTPASIIQQLRSDAAAVTTAVPSFGFAGDPTRPVSGRYYGYLARSAFDGSATPPPPPPPPPAPVTRTPSSATIETGTARSGSFSSLATDNNSYFAVNSTTTGTRTTSWYATLSSVPTTLSVLKATYKGKNSRSCTQVLAIYRWTDATWVTLDSRSVGTSEVALNDKAPPGSPSSYVSSAGAVNVRVRCTASSSFHSSGDLLKITYTE